MSNDLFNGIPSILQDSSFQNLLNEQQRWNSIAQSAISPISEKVISAMQSEQNLVNKMYTISPALQYMIQTENLFKVADHITTRFQQATSFDLQGLNCIMQSGELTGILQNCTLLHLYSDDTPKEDIDEIKEVNTKVLENIFNEDEHTNNKNEGSVIILSSINDDVLKYLLKNPQAIYQLSSDEFEIFMAEIYTKLGYHVERTQSTRDGGKDIIIRKPEVLGDFIYYVECKKYAANRPVGIGIVRSLSGTISADRVNGGILATTSYFTRDARKFVSDYNLQYQIKMQDYNEIQNLLRMVV